jgi:hypothetical protein
MLDCRLTRTRRLLRFSSATLVEKNQLAIRRKRCERRPQNVVTEMKTAIDAKQW